MKNYNLRQYMKQLLSKESISILALVAFALVWVFSQHLTFTSDSETYLQYAHWLTGRDNISPHWYLRTPGLPLLLIISGVVHLGTFKGFMLLQAAISISSVCLAYAIIKIYQPKYALIGGWLFAVSCVPFTFSSAVMTENINICCFLLLAYGLLSSGGRPRMLWLAVIANILLFLLKPGNYFIFLISFIFLSFYSRSKLTDLLRLTIPYIVVMMLYITCFSLLKLSHPGLEGMSAIFQGIRAVAYAPYKHGFNHIYGKANQEITDAVTDTNILYMPNGENYNILTSDLVKKYNKSAAEKIILKASMEVYAANPMMIWHWLVNFVGASANNYTGQMLFYPYMLKCNNIAIVSAGNGPKTALLLEHLRNYIHKRESIWSAWEQPIFNDFAGNPDKLLENIFMRPNHVYHWFIWQALDREVGPTEASKIFMGASMEGFQKYPKAMLVFVRDLLSYFLGPDIEYATGDKIIKLPNAQLGAKNSYNLLSSRMTAEIQNAYIPFNPDMWSSLHNKLGWLWLTLKPIIFVLALFTLVASKNTEMWKSVVLCWMLSLYNAFVVTIFADPFFRFSAISWVLTALVALQGIFYLGDKIRNIVVVKNTMVTE